VPRRPGDPPEGLWRNRCDLLTFRLSGGATFWGQDPKGPHGTRLLCVGAVPDFPRLGEFGSGDGGYGRFVNLVNEMPTVVTADTTAIANQLRPVLLKLNRELRREVHSLGVTGGQVALLVQIKYHPGIGIRELARLERVSVPGMSKFVARLQEAGLVARAPVAGDQRRVGLSLTADGQKVLRSVKSKRTAWLSARLRQLEPEQLEAIDAAIEPLAHLLEATEA
jgi:DNA-binding MarR family transcriptional regulator